MFEKRRPWPDLSHSEIVKRSRILVIDDTDFAYQSLFKNDGYTVDKWNDVESIADLEQGKYDLILLDLHGVGRDHSAEEGLGVLKHIKTANPAQIVIAYSNATFPLRYQSFFETADAVLSKTDDYLDFKRAVDDLLTKRFSKGFYIARISDELGAYGPQLAAILAKADKAIQTGDLEKLRRYLDKTVSETVTVDRVINIVSTAANIVGIWSA